MTEPVPTEPRVVLAEPMENLIRSLRAEISRLTSALSTAERERDEAKAKIDKARDFVAGLVRADNNRMGLGPDGRITGADTLPLQLLLGLSLTLREGLGRPPTEHELRTREVVEAAKAWRKSMQPVVANGQLPGTRPQTRALVAAVDALRTDKEGADGP